MPIELAETMTIAQLAEMLGTSRRTLQNWRKFGRGPKFVILGGGSIRYYRADVEEWLKKGESDGYAK